MSKKNVLVVSNNLGDHNVLGKWTIAVHPFLVNVVNNDEAAIELCHIEQFDIVVVDIQDNTIDSKKLHVVLPILQENVILLRYEGETTEELDENINAIFSAKKYKRIQRMLMLEPNTGSFSNLPSFSLN